MNDPSIDDLLRAIRARCYLCNVQCRPPLEFVDAPYVLSSGANIIVRVCSECAQQPDMRDREIELLRAALAEAGLALDIEFGQPEGQYVEDELAKIKKQLEEKK